MLTVGRRSFWKIICLALCVMTGGACVTDPIREKIEITVLPDDQLDLGVMVSVVYVDPARNAGAAERAALISSQLKAENDDWSRRFEGIEKFSETRTWTREDGRLVSVRHRAIIPIDEIGGFFYDTPASVFITRDGEIREMTIYPGTGSRADREQTEQLERRLDAWIAGVARYYASLGSLYEHLIANPDRKDEVVSVLNGGPDLLSPVERELVEDLDSSFEDVFSAISLGRDQTFSIQYLSRLVYDTLPAPIDIVVPGEVLESENLVSDVEPSRYSIRAVGLMESLGSLVDRWITPDPLSIVIHALITGDQDMLEEADLWNIEEPQIELVPSETVIREALISELTRPRSYRIVWIAQSTEE